MERLFGKLQFSFLAIFLLTMNATAGGAIAGKVTLLKGQVFIQRGSQKIQVKKDDTVFESDIIQSEAGTARITMIDSNLVDVYPRSKVEIAKYVYKPNQDQKEVELKIDFGKIKSTVNQKYDGAKNKFQVKTPSAVAGVRGTVFTAEYDAVKKVSKVITIEGLVAVSKMIDRERQAPPVFVRPDQVVKVDVEQSKPEQPRDLKPEEREASQKEDKDLGYQYDPKKDPSTQQPPEQSTGAQKESSKDAPKDTEQANRRETKEPTNETITAREQVKEIKEQAREQIKEIRDQAKETSSAEPNKDNTAARPSVREQVKEIREQAKERIKEARQAKEVEVREPVKEVSAREPVKEVNIREPVKEIKNSVTTAIDNTSARQQQQQQNQERRQKESEEEQSKKQKQLEDEQTRKQKQLEEEQNKKQKQSEEEQTKKQKQLEDEQAKKQKHVENEQTKKQQRLEEEMKRRAQEEAQKKAELARRLAEIAKRGETTIISRPPSVIDSPTTIPGTTTLPKN